MAHCDEYLELISAAIDGALSPAQQEKLNAHLASCAECQKLYDDLLSLHATLAGLPPVEVPEGLKGRIMDAVAAEAEGGKVLPFAPKKASRHWQRWLASAAVLAVVVMGTWSWKPWENRADLPRADEAARGMDSASFPVTGTAGAADGAAPAALAPQPSSLSAPADAPEETAPAAVPELASAPLDAAAPTADFTTESADTPAEKNAVRSAKAAPSPSPNVAAAPQGFGASAPTVPAENGAAPSGGETVYGYAPVGQAPDVSSAENAPGGQTSPAEFTDISSLQSPAEAPAPQSAVMPRLFSAPVPSDAGVSNGSGDSQPTPAPRLSSIAPAVQAIPSPAGEEVPEQGVTSQAEAVNVLVNYIYEFVGDVELVEDSGDSSYAVNSPTGVSGVVTCVGENQEVYFLNYKDDLSPDPLLYSVNKQTSEVLLLEQEEFSALPAEEITP